MNDNLKKMWDSVRKERPPSQKEFRTISPEGRVESKLMLKVDTDFSREK